MLVLTCVWTENIFPCSQEDLHGQLRFWGHICPLFFALLWIKSNSTECSMSPWLPNKLKIRLRYILIEILYHPQNSKQLLFSFKSLHTILYWLTLRFILVLTNVVCDDATQKLFLLLLIKTLTFKPVLRKLPVISGSFWIWSDISILYIKWLMWSVFTRNVDDLHFWTAILNM